MELVQQVILNHVILAMGSQPVTITDNTYKVWQTVLAAMLVAGIITGRISWLSKKIAKRSDIDKIRQEGDERKKENTEQNQAILELVKEIRDDIKSDRARLDAHIDASRVHRTSPPKAG